MKRIMSLLLVGVAIPSLYGMRSTGNIPTAYFFERALAQVSSALPVPRSIASSLSVGTKRKSDEITPSSRVPITHTTFVGSRASWRVPTIDESQIEKFMTRYGIGKYAARAVIARGFLDDVTVKLNTIGITREEIPHPSLLKDADRAADRILRAVARGEKILICGDYDVDGMTSSALLMRCLGALGAKISFKIPHRVRDGYGLKVPTVEQAKRDGFSVMITVDNGTTAFDAANKAKELGIDLIITDHHLAHGGLPDAYAIVNPNQPACTYPNKGLAGVGVAFKLATLIYERVHTDLPNQAFELMALGTVADVVPLTPENRYWIKYGLGLINAGRASAAFKKLWMNNSFLAQKPRINSVDIAFNIAPQLNALGRLEDANDGVRFLLGDNGDEVGAMGDILWELNNERKKIQGRMFDMVKQRIQDHEVNLSQERVIILADPDWHIGINGLVASKIVERYRKPTILFKEFVDESGQVLLKGSGRSTQWFDLFKALSQCKDLLITFGGHVCAAGVTLKKSNFEAFKNRMNQIVAGRSSSRPYANRHIIDSVVSFEELDDAMVADFERLEPFGSDNPQPTLMFRDVCVSAKPTFMGRKHVQCLLKSGSVERVTKFFFRPDMFYRLQEMKDQLFTLIGNPSLSYENGRGTVEILGLDIERPAVGESARA